jgi:hypothetical protein
VSRLLLCIAKLYFNFTLIACSGGLFAGKVTSTTDVVEGRFDPNSGQMGVLYRARYVNDGYLEAVKLLKEVAVSLLLAVPL